MSTPAVRVTSPSAMRSAALSTRVWLMIWLRPIFVLA